MKHLGQFLVVVAFIGLSAAMVLSAWSFMNSDRQWRQTYILLGQTGEIQSRAHKLQEKLTRITGYLELAAKTGEESPRLPTTMIGLKTNIQELLSADYLDEFLSENEITALTTHLHVADASYLSMNSTDRSYPDVLQQLHPVKENVSRILAVLTARAQILGETTQMESKTSAYRLLFALGSVLFLVAAIALYLAFFLLNVRKTISDLSHRSSLTSPPAG
ncbi:hypothetical protein [Phyllobacterium sp. YR531]|uniref:hypothetical protein n=1 Tax=Phyllobacterium sp. YR531 TaxID=1144343 RepID=UPI00026F875D|nr:hypothetical protein [Phyllobacterium sp. YR531]EJN01717.1 hypothetical protein PMI41_03433 [Phyllobacterium sp. YR531]